MDSPGDVTQLLQDWRNGDKSALDRLIPIVYDELRRIASSNLRRRSANQTLQTTALVHEAYMRLVDRQALDWQNRTHFFAVAAKMMRGILVNYSIANSTEKRGGGNVKLSLDKAMGTPDNLDNREFDILALNEALKALEVMDERQGRIVELRFFAGLSNEEIAEVLGISLSTVDREWRTAKAWLRSKIVKSKK